MYEKYVDDEIARIWFDQHKLDLWQQTEFAVVRAREELGRIEKGTYWQMHETLSVEPIDLEVWKQKEHERNHDLQGFIEERIRFLSPELQEEFHKHMTSFDTEEPAFARMLKESILVVLKYYWQLEVTLIKMASRHRYTIMGGITHGQFAELQSLGKRCLTWIQQLRVSAKNLIKSAENLKYSKLSGAIGNYGGLDPALEEKTLFILGFEPFYGSTQTMPRELYVPIAQALSQIARTLDKIAVDIRLGARSGQPIYQESFGKKQRGSSKMPHKRNTISSERIGGMARMASGYYSAIEENIASWEERDIAQSSVERVAWPDLFHVTVYSLKLMDKILSGLEVYPDNMLRGIIESRGCYASGEAKEVLKELLVGFNLGYNEAYDIIQLVAFNIFEPSEEELHLREFPAKSFDESDRLLDSFEKISEVKSASIQQIISEGKLMTSPILAATQEQVDVWNIILKKIFQNQKNLARWNEIFKPSYLLKNEAILYEKILPPNLPSLSQKGFVKVL